MRWGAAVALLSLVMIMSPAQAEFHAAPSAWAGAGAGWGHREEVWEAGPFGLGGVEAAWRFAPGRALVATHEGAGGPFGISYIPEGPHLDGVEHGHHRRARVLVLIRIRRCLLLSRLGRPGARHDRPLSRPAEFQQHWRTRIDAPHRERARAIGCGGTTL